MSKREQEWSYPLPSLTFTESDASPLLDIEENSTASATTSESWVLIVLVWCGVAGGAGYS